MMRRRITSALSVSVLTLLVAAPLAVAAGEGGSFVSPPPGAVVSWMPVPIQADVVGTAVTSAPGEVTLDGGPATGCVSAPIFSGPPNLLNCMWDPTGTAEGVHTLMLRLWDGAGYVDIPGSARPITVDITAPAGGSLTVPTQSSSSTSVDIAFTAGTELHPIALILERQQAPRTGGVCGAYGPFAPVNGNLRLETSPWTDTTLVADTCYRYQAIDVDAASNVATYTPTNVVEVTSAAPPSPPALSLALTAGGSATKAVGSTVYYNPAWPNVFGSISSFTVTATPSGGSGTFSQVAFPDVDGAAANGWTPAGVLDTTAPFEQQYTYAVDATSTGTHTVTVTDSNMLTATAQFTVVADTAGPTGATITPTLLTDGDQPRVSVAFTPGTDPAGVIETSIQRAVGTFDGTECDEFSAYAQIATSAASPFVDPALEEDRCYAYRVSSIDGTLNTGTADAARFVIVDLQKTTRTGTTGADNVSGTDADELFLLGRGNDVARLGGGDDAASGGSGNDRISGNLGDDCRILGGNGKDTLFGGPGDDCLEGNADDDELHGGAGTDSLQGGTGDDVLTGGGGSDPTLDGGAGDDRIGGGTGADTLDGGAGDDKLFGHEGADRLTGGTGTDLLDAGDGDDVVHALVDDADTTFNDPIKNGAVNVPYLTRGNAKTRTGNGDDTLHLTIDRAAVANFTHDLGAGDDHVRLTLTRANGYYSWYEPGNASPADINCGPGTDSVSVVRTPVVRALEQQVAQYNSKPNQRTTIRELLVFSGKLFPRSCETVRVVDS